MSTEMNLKERLKGPTPDFFKRIIKIALTIAAAGGAVLTADATIPGFHVPAVLNTASQYMVLAGVVAAAISKTTKQDTP